jgi:hypothetical protein
MMQFFKFILKLIALTIGLSIVVYIGLIFFFHDYHKRGKTDKRGLQAEVVFFGSSRCVNTVVPSVFDSIAGTNSYNMGWAASGPREIYAAVSLYLRNNALPRVVFIQLDLNHDVVDPSDLAQQGLLKYYFTDEIPLYYTEEIKNEMRVPLLANALQRDFGWREIVKTLIRNHAVSDESKGYAKVEEVIDLSRKLELTEVSNSFASQENPWIRRSISLLNEQGVDVFVFTSPYYSSQPTDKLDRLHLYSLPYFNLSKCIANPEMFSDVSHLNHSGSLVFTDSLARRYIEFKSRQN